MGLFSRKKSKLAGTFKDDTSYYNSDTLEDLYSNIADGNIGQRLDAILKLGKVKEEKAYTELINSTMYDQRGECRVAAMVALAHQYLGNPKIKDMLEKTVDDKAGAKNMMGEYIQFYPIMALAIIHNYNIEKALDFSFSEKMSVTNNINNAPLERTSSNVEKVALAVVWFSAIDGGKGDPLFIDSISVHYPNFKPFIKEVLEWMKESL